MATPSRTARPDALRVWGALWIVYLVWGSTYLAIRLMVRTMPPLLASGSRFLVAGLLLCAAIAMRRGVRSLRTGRRALLGAALLGLLLPAGGNGLVTVAERHLPSSLAALIIATVPLWVVVFRIAGRQALPRSAVAGVLIGFGGVALLLLPSGTRAGVDGLSIALVIVAAVSWAGGSFLTPRLVLPRDPWVTTGLEMVAGGVALLLAGLIGGEAGQVHFARMSAESIGGFAYLVTIGSIVAYAAYVWLLQNVPISTVSTYAYVNPVVAVLLGWAVLDERVETLTLGGAAIVVSSVAAILRRAESG